MKNIKRIGCILLAFVMVLVVGTGVFAGGEQVEVPNAMDAITQAAEESEGLQVDVKSAILMDAKTMTVLFEQNADEQLAPASITKIMTLLLVMEALDEGKISLDDMVTCSEHAASMGGSQIWLEPNEQMSVHDLLKATAVSSANDAAVALGEFIAGSEEEFVALMNSRAQELGMKNTVFKNASGLDEEGHISSARDIAIMSCELLKHEKITEYSTIWMDYLRDGATELVNTNKLVRSYEGITGLKTGTTDGAGSCLSASAQRGDLSLVAVVMGASTSDIRFQSAKKLLDHGFANYSYMEVPNIDDQLTPVPVLNGVDPYAIPQLEKIDPVLVNTKQENNIELTVQLAQNVKAPVLQGQKIGEVTLMLNGEEIARYPITAQNAVEQMTLGRAFGILWSTLLNMKS